MERKVIKRPIYVTKTLNIRVISSEIRMSHSPQPRPPSEEGRLILASDMARRTEVAKAGNIKMEQERSAAGQAKPARP